MAAPPFGIRMMSLATEAMYSLSPACNLSWAAKICSIRVLSAAASALAGNEARQATAATNIARKFRILNEALPLFANESSAVKQPSLLVIRIVLDRLHVVLVGANPDVVVDPISSRCLAFERNF